MKLVSVTIREDGGGIELSGGREELA
jgi:hypothetical protein